MNVKLNEAQKIKVLNSHDVAVIMQQILKRENKIGRSQEHFWVVGLNNANKILFIELLGLGRQNRVTANPPDVFRMAIYKLAVKMILVHNHPSGEINPSTADREMTDRMLKVGEIINVDVIEHLIITETEYFSFQDSGIMHQLKQSDTWRIVDKNDAYMKEIQLDIEKSKAERKKAADIAKKLKAQGMDEATIKQVTGLRLAEIRKL